MSEVNRTEKIKEKIEKILVRCSIEAGEKKKGFARIRIFAR